MSGPISLEPGGPEQETLAIRLADTRRSVRKVSDDHTVLLDTRRIVRRVSADHTMALRIPRFQPDEEAVSMLAADLAERVGPAVHPYEVAALLESEGLTASLIQERYGHPNLFSLATALYERVPRTFPQPALPADPWRPDTLRCLLRGALFALPGLAFLLTAPLWNAGGHTTTLVVAGLFSWAWGQALGHRAHLRMATGRREAGRTLLLGAPLGAVLATATAGAQDGFGPVTLVAGAQSVYLAAAGALLVLGRERLLLAALSPLIVGAAVLPWWEPGKELRAGLPLLALLATLVVCGAALRSCLRTPPQTTGRRPKLLWSLPYGLFGLAAGTLVLLEGKVNAYAVIVLTVSMGPAEWLLYRYRGMSVAALRATATPARFLLRSTGVLALCLLIYLGPLFPAALLSKADPATLLTLAATLWTALLLQAFGAAWPAATICLLAAGTAALVTRLELPPGDAILPLSCCGAALLLIVCALRMLGRPSPHA
ncbi:hypothetical protein [Streptomyces sp. NBC_00102]|uniref:hypothetical protein n=1 Tax=Streptomyces sp. NBC_00102 TaxID=2975652 RepID=UPI002251357A|nr:hypothetical protein [Streptomyces sp. NBC_00102]MCX5401215.1 hypothetical protein [Streptomyces sp. NBC_00102]